MTEQERIYFEAIRRKRLRTLEALDNPMDKGIFDIVQNLYKDKAHFVYELLQNADDQGATEVRFVLTRDSLVFAHNAPRHFTITDPEKHEEDQAAGRLGDINSIVAIASSAKRGRDGDRVPIGKFGIGFKSVFQYTTCPEIYDEGIAFAIRDYILPELIGEDHPDRKPGETLFFFPFNKDNREAACDEISDTLRKSGGVRPLLFLNSLAAIDWQVDGEHGSYSLTPVETVGSGTVLRYETTIGDETSTEVFWKFERPLREKPGLKVAVVYRIDEATQRIDDSKKYPLYCYLPTADGSRMPAMLHAPFQLSNNRENIEAGNAHNTRMIEMLASLLADSLAEICRIGEAGGLPRIDDNIISFLPPGEVLDGSLNIRPLKEKVLEATAVNPMLWCADRRAYMLVENGAVPDAEYLPELYSSEELSELFGCDYGWVLTSLKARNKDDAGIIKELNLDRITNQKIVAKISGEFLARRSHSWLLKWYPYLLKVKDLWNDLKYKDIILTTDGTFRAPFVRGKTDSNVHLPGPAEIVTDGSSDACFADPILVGDENVMAFLRGIGLTEVSDLTKAENIYLPKIQDGNNSIEVRLKALATLAKLCNERLGAKDRKIFEDRALCPVFRNGDLELLHPEELKIHNEINDFYFRGNDEAVFFEPSALSMYLSDEETSAIERFVASCPETAGPRIIRGEINVTPLNEKRVPAGAQRPAWYNRYKSDAEYFQEFDIEGLEHFSARNAVHNPAMASRIIADCIGRIKKEGGCCYKSIYYGQWTSADTEPQFFEELRQASWIGCASRELKKLLGLPVEELSAADLQKVGELLSSSGVASAEQVAELIEYIKASDILESFQLEKEIKEQKEKIGAIQSITLQWLDEILNLRLKYVEAKQKDDITLLIKRLKDTIESTGISPDADLRTMLSDNIEVLFGPPGTGKTTHISRIVAGAYRADENAQILILTPTHHSADVVALKIQSEGCPVLRAVNTNSSFNKELTDSIAELGLEVTNGCSEEGCNIIACTVHYFSDILCGLQDNPWDMIIIDEASMVTLDYALLALVKGHEVNPACRFIVAGDPLQLPAITNLDPFILEKTNLDEFNFFSFIGLKEFSDDASKLSEPVRTKIKITLLKKQYRSVEPLARLTGKFAYNDRIEPQRGKEMEFKAPEGALPIFRQPLSFVRFPISNRAVSPNGETAAALTDLDKLNGSNYQIYSALLIVESLQHLFDLYSGAEIAEDLRVGIITPYIGQKELLSEIIRKNGLTRPAGISVEVNTVHQFQGDEFDIVMLVLNPPNCSMNPANGIMINKLYLINVATSRAKDCLVVLYPDDYTCKAPQNFWFVNSKSDRYNLEKAAGEIFGRTAGEMTFHSSEIETMLFGEPDYLAGHCRIEHRNPVNLHRHDSSLRYYFNTGGNSIDIIIPK